MKYLIPSNKLPRNNLPKNTSRKRKESDFVLAFARKFSQEIFKKNGHESFITARELQIPGLGIADLILLGWNNSNSDSKRIPQASRHKPTLFTFEIKIKDWRKAIAQAYRYKYYSNAVHVVLPPNEAKKAKQFLHTFRSIRIGLWSFDKAVFHINKIYSPKQSKPLNNTTYNKALNLIRQHFKSLPAF